jgi:hypothetical protein
MSTRDLDSQLVTMERQKWRALAEGKFGSVADLFAEDFINVAWLPEKGMVRQPRAEALAALAKFPASQEEIPLSDFQLVHATDGAVIVTYKAAAPFGLLFATSVWARRGGEWKTVFYQASVAK